MCIYLLCSCRCQDKETILAEIESRTKIELGKQTLDLDRALIEEARQKTQLAHERALATAESRIELKLAEEQTAAIIADTEVKVAVERTRQYEIEREIQEKESQRQNLALTEFTALREAGKDALVHELIKLLQAVKIKSRFNISPKNSCCAKFAGDVRATTSNNTANLMCKSAHY